MNPKFLAPAILALSLPAHAALIAHYEFNNLNDTTGTTGALVVNDRSGSAAYTVGSGVLSLSEVSTNDSTFDYLTAPNFGFGVADAWTLAFDVRDNGSGGAGGQSTAAAIISSQSPGEPDSWQLNLSGSSGVSENTGAGTFGSLSGGGWHTIRLVNTGTEISVYFNGVDVTTSATWPSARVSLENLTFANRGTNIQAGVDIDNVMVWDTAVIPEPSSALLGGLGMLMLLRRRR